MYVRVWFGKSIIIARHQLTKCVCSRLPFTVLANGLTLNRGSYKGEVTRESHKRTCKWICGNTEVHLEFYSLTLYYKPFYF